MLQPLSWRCVKCAIHHKREIYLIKWRLVHPLTHLGNGH